MQLTIDIKPTYENQVIGILENLKNVMIDKIEIKQDEFYINSSKKQAEMFKQGKLQTYSIDKLWDMVDD
jgi:hypothetical protein